MTGFQGRRLERVGMWTVLLCVPAAALAMGALDLPVLAVVTVLLAVGCAVLMWSAEPLIPRTSAKVLFYVGVGLTAFTLLQAIPMPFGLVRVLSPHAATVWEGCLRPLGEGPPAWVSISTDPFATHVEVVKGLAYLAAFVATLFIARNKQGLDQAYKVLAASAAIVAIVAVVHIALNLDRGYGFYTSKDGLRTYASFINSNHLAGYINIGFVLGFFSMISPRPLIPRPLLFVHVIFLGAVEVWIGSRGALGASAAAMVLSVLIHRRTGSARVLSLAVAGALALFGVAFVILAISEESRKGVMDADLSKLGVARDALVRMVAHYPLFGAGRGSFASSYAEFSTATGYVAWTHPENIVVQWVSEWGVPVSAGAAGAILVALRPRASLIGSSTRAGPWIVVAVTALHNLVDFNSEVPATGLALAVCAGVACSGAGQADPSKPQPRWASHPRQLGIVVAVLAFVAVIALVGRPGQEMLEERESIRRSVPTSTRDDFHALVRAAMLRHPAQPYFPYVGAARAAYAADESVMPWIERTLDRAPVYPPAHLLLARMLRRVAPAQARVEYRLYAEQMGGQPLTAPEVEGVVRSLDDLLEVSPSGADSVPLFDALSVRIADRLPATAYAIDREILVRSPVALGATERAATAAIDDLADAPWCQDDARPACVTEGDAWTRRVLELRPGQCAGLTIRARFLVVSGRTADAIDVLRGSAGTDRALCHRLRAEIAIEASLSEEANAAIAALADEPCTPDMTCTANLSAAAALEDRRGRPSVALTYLRQAKSRHAEDDELALQVARRASQLGLHGEAAQTYDSLARRHPDKPDYATLASAERSRMLQP